MDICSGSMTIYVTHNSSHGLKYHRHERRDEVWTIISSTGRIILDNYERHVKADAGISSLRIRRYS